MSRTSSSFHQRRTYHCKFQRIIIPQFYDFVKGAVLYLDKTVKVWYNKTLKGGIFKKIVSHLLSYHTEKETIMKKYDFVPKDFLFEIDDGWMPSLEKMLDEVKELADEDPFTYESLRLKVAESDCGLLHVSFNIQTEQLSKIISKYVRITKKICESCGKDRKNRKAITRFYRSKIETLCDECYETLLQK